MEIVLTQGKVTVVDDADAPMVAGHHWTAMRVPNKTRDTWYAKATGPGNTSILMHRLLLGAEKGQLVDHKDGNGLNNRRENIRLASHQGNAANRRSVRGSEMLIRTAYRGVYKPDDEFFFIVRVGHDRIGKYATAEAAAAAFDEAARKRYGEFARLNFPREGELAAFEEAPEPFELIDPAKAKASRKMLPDGVMDVYRRFLAGESPTRIARSHGVDRRLVYAIGKGQMWNHVTGAAKPVGV
jgi:hypothetical protein